MATIRVVVFGDKPGSEKSIEYLRGMAKSGIYPIGTLEDSHFCIFGSPNERAKLLGENPDYDIELIPPLFGIYTNVKDHGEIEVIDGVVPPFEGKGNILPIIPCEFEMSDMIVFVIPYGSIAVIGGYNYIIDPSNSEANSGNSCESFEKLYEHLKTKNRFQLPLENVARNYSALCAQFGGIDLYQTFVNGEGTKVVAKINRIIGSRKYKPNPEKISFLLGVAHERFAIIRSINDIYSAVAKYAAKQAVLPNIPLSCEGASRPAISVDEVLKNL